MDGATVLGSASVNGSATATFSTTTLAGGTHSIVAVYGGDTAYAASQGTTQVVVSQADFNVTIPTVSATVHAGQSATYTINVAALNGFTGTVSFNCSSGLPSLTTCGFNPATVAANGSTTLTITTTAPTSAPPASGLSAGLSATLGIFGLTLFGGLAAGKRRGRPLFMLLGVLALAAGLISCGGGGTKVMHNPGTPTGTSTVTITATSGATTHTTTVTLVVQ
jgi:hypothetical protein